MSAPLNRTSQIQTDRLAPGTRARIFGAIDEHCPLEQLSSVDFPLVLDLAEVDFINSCGLRAWVHFLRSVRGRGELTVERCSERMVMQLNMVADAHVGVTVKSFYAPYECDACGHEEARLLVVRTHFPSGRHSPLPVFDCPDCRQPMSLAEQPERYLLFLD
jgi:hypothetical protein